MDTVIAGPAPADGDQYARVVSVLPTPRPSRHVVTVEAFERMIEAGVFGADERVELIEGEMLDMSPIGSVHQACVDRLNALFAPLGASREAIVRVQGAIRAGDISRPQPDLALLRPREDYYAPALPGAEDVLLVVEVADTSLRFDRWTKLPIYARVGIPEAWVVDLNGGVIDVATEPSPEGYGRVVQHVPGATVVPGAFPDISVPVSQALGLPGKG